MGGTFIFNCLSCGQPLQGALEHVGQLVECPYCSFRLPVPPPAAGAPPAPPPAYPQSPPAYQQSPPAYAPPPPQPQYAPPKQAANAPPMQVHYRPVTPADSDSGNEIRALDEPSPATAARPQSADPFAGNSGSSVSGKEEVNAFGGDSDGRVVERIIERVVYEPPPRGFFKAFIFDSVGLILILGGVVCAGWIFIQAGRIVVDPDSMKPQLDKISKLIEADSLDVEKDGKKARWGKPLSMILLQLWYFIQAIVPLMAMSVGARVAWPDAKKKDDD